MTLTYTRQSSFSDGDTITAALFNDEYNELVNAFAYSTSSGSTGHQHDGTAAEGGSVHTIGDLDFLNKIVADSTNNRWGVFVEVSSAAVEQIRISDGVISPVTDIKDLFIDGTAHVDTLDVDVNGTVAGTFGVTGATTLSSTLAVTGAVTGSSTIQGTTITATTAFVPDASDGAALGTSALEFSDLFLADGAVINFGDDQDVSLTHVADTGILLSSTDQLQFGDSGTYIYQSADGVLDLVSDTEIELTATTIDINGNVDISGTLAVAGALDFGDAALSNVGAVQLDSIAGDGDTDTSITFSGSNVITVAAAGTNQVTFNDGSILPVADNDIDLGSGSYEFKDAYFDGTVTTDALVADTADINGGTVDGAIIGGASAAAITGTAITGTSFVIGSADISEAELETIDGVTAGTVAASKAVVVDSNKDIGTFRNVTIDGTFSDGNYTFDTSGNVSGLGTIGSGAITSTGTVQGTTITATTAFVPDASDGAALGTSALEFSDLFLADGAVINFGDDQDVSLTHVADTGLLISSTDQLQFGDSGTYIYQSADGVLDLVSDTEIELTATTIDINGNVDVSGTLTVAGALDFGDAVLSNVGAVQLDSIAGDGDTNTSITFSGSDVITIATGGSGRLTIGDGALSPVTDNEIDLGTSSLEFKNAYFDGTVTSDAFAGPLTGDVTGNVSGTALTVTQAAQTNITSLGTLTALTVDDVAINGKVVTMTGSTDDTATVTVGTNGTLAITTVDTAAAAANMTLTADGTFEAVGTTITLDSGTSITSTAFVGALTGNVTGNTSGTAATVTTAAQTNITSLGTLTALTVDDVAIDGKVVTMTGSSSDTAVFTAGTNGTLSIVTTDAAAAAANIQITADGTVDIDSAGVLTLDSGAAINIEPAAGSAILLDGTISIDAGVVTGATSITSTAFVGDITGDVTGTSSKATVTDSTANTNFPVVFHNESDGLLDDTGALRYNPSTGELLVPKLTVAGTTTTVDTVTMQAENAIIFEGATADAYETTLSIVDPTADHTQYLINQGGYIPLLAAATTTAISSTPAELNILDGATVVVGEINALDLGSTAVGTAIASKAVILDSSKDYTGLRNLTITGELDAATLDISGAIDVAGTSNLDVVDIDGAVDMASTLQVDGVITTSDGMVITTADNTDTLSLISTDADANSGPNLRLYRNSANPADSDLFGQIDFEGRNDNSQDFVGVQISTATGDVSDGSEDAEIRFDVMTAGTLREYLRLASGGSPSVIINQDSQDINFQVQSDDNTNMLFVDGGNDVIGIGTGSPNSAVSMTISSDGSGSVQPGVRLIDSNSGDDYQIYTNAGNFYVRNATDGRSDIAIDGDGDATFGGKIVATELDISGAIDVDGTTNLDVVDIDGAVDMASTLAVAGVTTLSEDVTFTGANQNVVWDKSADSLEFADAAYAKFGDGNDLTIVHNGTHSYIKDTGQGNLIISGTVINLQKSDNSEHIAIFTEDGSCALYYDDSKKFETSSAGATITGVATASQGALVTEAALADGSTAVDASTQQNCTLVLEENTTIGAPSSPVAGQVLVFEIAQHATSGPYTLAWNTVFEFAASTAPTMTATDAKTDIFTFRYNGSVWQEIGRVQNMAQT